MVKGMVKDEIGSEFWDVPLSEYEQNEFPKSTKWFISGTSALQFILEDIKRGYTVTRAAIPSWCCSCMIEPFIRRDIQVFFYFVYIDALGQLTSDYTTAPPCDITLTISYFGYTGQNQIGNPSGIIVRDLTHSLFSEKKQEAAYYFGSLRKWAGFWTGGYAWKTGEWNFTKEIPKIDPDYIALRKRAMEGKLEYLQGKREGKNYLGIFEEAEDYLDHSNIMEGCQRDIYAALHFDINTVRQKRRKNAEALLGGLRKYALFQEIGKHDNPLFVPIILETEKRDGLRRHLIENRIYCPVHWGITDFHQLTDEQRYLYDHELSIVCDQRYGQKEMERIIDRAGEYLRSHN